MSENKKPGMSERFAGLKAEFNKIVWASPETIGKQSTAVVVVSVVIGLIIVVVDAIINFGIDKLVNL